MPLPPPVIELNGTLRVTETVDVPVDGDYVVFEMYDRVFMRERVPHGYGWHLKSDNGTGGISVSTGVRTFQEYQQDVLERKPWIKYV